jgi:hypothetical protein
LVWNFDRALSRIPAIDGPCDVEPDHSCQDPPDVDEYGHGTPVAGSSARRSTVSGPRALRPTSTLPTSGVGRECGFLFVQPVVDALTYAGDHGIDVANMSFFIDPWL